MSSSYTYVSDLAGEGAIPEDGVLSRTLHNDDTVKVVFFAFSAGEELSEHTASMPAILHFLSGEARITVGGDAHGARAGTWVHMKPDLKHSIYAESPTTMLLILLKGGQH